VVIVVRRFSALGVTAVATLIASGIVNTLFVIDRVELIWTTAYGRALLAKVILFAGMLILATFNRLALTPALAQSTEPSAHRRVTHRLCVHSAIEIALGIAIILIVAWLGIMQPAVTAEHMH
jgi:putative copper resistance protein D